MQRLNPPKLFFLVFIFLPWLGFGQKGVKSSSVPSWVDHVDYSYQAADTVHSGGFYYLLLESQYNILHKESFFRTSLKVLNHKGLESASSISVNYDPSYQSLVFHTLQVKRGSTIIDKLPKSNFEVIRREQNLDRSVYDKSLDAILNLDDIQVGDVIEYSYSLTGYNPVFKNTFFKTLYFNYSSPVGRSFIRVICPSEKNLHFKKFNKATDPVTTQNKNVINYTWNQTDIPAYLMEDKAPNWFDPYDRVQISEYETWENVITWALPLYSTKSISSVAIDKKLAAIKEKNKLLDEQINDCIQFVQDEIRYLAFADGVQGYKPHKPALVFDQRFGDCKDKSLLLSYMLQKLGVESYPALVNTETGKVLDEQLPSPGAFDHCIVYMSYQDSTFWIDPTITLERGTLRLKQTPNYYQALILSHREKSLRSIVRPHFEADRIIMYEDYTLNTVGGSARLNVKSEYFGGEGDYMRSYWKSNSAQEINKSYTDFYANDYIEIQTEKDIEFYDDEINNIIRTEENYSIENFWNYDSAENKYTVDFYPRSLAAYLTTPASKRRTMPYKISYPVDITQTITIHLPESWSITAGSKKISSKGFEYTSAITAVDSKTAVLRYTYRSLKADLDAKDVKNHLQQIDAALNDLSFKLTYTKPLNSASGLKQINIPYLLISLFSLFLIFLAMRKLDLYDPRSSNYEFGYDQIGGWMVLPFIGVFTLPLFSIVSIFKGEYFEYYQWRILTDPGYGTYSPALGSIILGELLYSLLMIGYSILLMRQIIQKRTSLPLLICIFLGVHVLSVLVENACLHLVTLPSLYVVRDLSYQLIQAGLGAVIWIPYFLRSERVKGTFTNRLSRSYR